MNSVASKSSDENLKLPYNQFTFMVREIVKMQFNGRMTIPKSLRENMELKQGDLFFVYELEGKIVLEPVMVKPKTSK